MWLRLLPYAALMVVIGVNSFLSPGSDSGLRLDSVKPLVVPGLLVYAYWVRMDWSRAVQVEVMGWNSFQGGATAGWVVPGIRSLECES